MKSLRIVSELFLTHFTTINRFVKHTSAAARITKKGKLGLLKIYILFLFFSFYSGFTQNNVKHKVSQFELLKNKTEEIAKIKPDSASKFADDLLYMAKASKSENFIATALSVMVDVKIRQSMPDLADSLNKISLAKNLKIGNRVEIAKNYSQSGTICQNKGDYVNATIFFNKSLDFSDENSQMPLVKYNYRCLSKINSIQKNSERALFYARKSISGKASLGAKDIGLGLISMADYYVDVNKIDSAEKYYKQAFELFDKNKIEHSKAWVLSLWSIIYAEKDLIKTIGMMHDAQAIFDKIAPESVFSANNIGNMGEVYFMIARNDSLINLIKKDGLPNTKVALLSESEKFFLRALDYSEKSKNAYTFLYMSGNLADLKAYKGDYKSAYENLLNKFKYNDSLFSQKNKNAIAKLESEKEILELNAENKQKSNNNKILIGLVLGLSVLSFLGYRNFRNRQKIQQLKITELEKDKQLLAVDAILQGQEEERNRIAKDLHDGLGGMLSGVKMSFVNMKENLIMDAENVKSFEKSILQLDSTIAELRKVAHNLMPEALAKFGLKDAIKDFCNSMEGSSHVKIIYQFFGEERSIGNTAEVYIYRIIQELVSNAIKHAEPTQIVVQMTLAEKNILLTIEDNGIGIDSSKKRNSSGIGLKSVQQRVDYLNGKLDFENNEPTGTVVNIELNA